jgi:flagellar motor switch protein FliN/FliY
MTAVANHIDLEPLIERQEQGSVLAGSILPFLGSVKVQVVVRVGGAQTSVAELLDMKEGAVLALDRLVDQPLDVLVHDHVVARGTLVAVGEYFGVRITETATLGPPVVQP